MKKENETPRVEKLEFDYSDVISTSGGGSDTPKCLISGIGVTWSNQGSACSNQVPGDQ